MARQMKTPTRQGQDHKIGILINLPAWRLFTALGSACSSGYIAPPWHFIHSSWSRNASLGRGHCLAMRPVAIRATEATKRMAWNMRSILRSKKTENCPMLYLACVERHHGFVYTTAGKGVSLWGRPVAPATSWIKAGQPCHCTV